MGNKEGEKKIIQIEYKPVGRKINFLKELVKGIPKQFHPTQKTLYILLIIFIIMIGYGIIKAMAPVTDLSFSLDEEAEPFELQIHVGWPWQFFGTTEDGMEMKISLMHVILDLIIILVLSYMLDVLINFLFSVRLRPDPEKLKQKPKTFMFKQKTTGEKIAEKVAGTGEKTPSNNNKQITNNSKQQIVNKVP